MLAQVAEVRANFVPSQRVEALIMDLIQCTPMATNHVNSLSF